METCQTCIINTVNSSFMKKASAVTELNKKNAVPLYEQVMSRLKGMMDAGQLHIGDTLPNEVQLCERFGVSRITVRRAVAELVRQGYLEKKQGKGTFVTVPGSTMDLTQISSFSDTCRRRGSVPSTKVLDCRLTAANQKDRLDLKIGQDQKVVESVRIRYSDRIPVMIEINHFSLAYSYLTECDLDGSLYSILQEFGVQPSKAVHDISLTRAEGTVATQLKVPEGTPLLYLEEVIYDQKGRPLHNSRQWIRGDQFTFRI